jgi:hypothetical protein
VPEESEDVVESSMVARTSPRLSCSPVATR